MAEGALLGETPVGMGLSLGSAGVMDHSRGEEEPWAPAGPDPARARPSFKAAGRGSGAGGCPAMAALCAGVGPKHRGLVGRGGSTGNLAMAVWSALGFLFLLRSGSCTRSRLRQP